MSRFDGGADVFPETIVTSVADRHDVPAETLRELVERHQTGVAATPGVDELVYEWRKHFDGVLLERTGTAYYLSVPEWVWTEFGDHLDATESELEALVATHRATTDRLLDGDSAPSDGRTYVVLRR